MTHSIAGIYAVSTADRSRLDRVRAARVFASGPLALSHSGSALLDGELVCVLSGHIDNARALAIELGIDPARPVERVLLAGYRLWGEELLARLRGEFALVLWDGASERGLLARDQLGVRGLYLHESAGTLYFATEIRELLELLPRRPAPDHVGVAHWAAASARPGTATLYEGVRALAPAGVVALGGGEARERIYWRARFREPRPTDISEGAAQVRRAIARAVQARIPDRGGTAVLMSGGLDSGAVAAFATRPGDGRVSALSGVFPEHPSVDESGLIGGLRRDLGLGGYDAEVRPGGLLAAGIESLRRWQLPSLSWGDFWTLPLLRAAADAGAGTVIGGDGGDELFATRAYLLADRLRAGDPRSALRLAGELPGAALGPSNGAVLRMAGLLSIGGAAPVRLHDPLRRALAARMLPAWLGRRARADVLASSDELAWKRLDAPRWWAHAAHGLCNGVAETGLFELHRHRAAIAGIEARHPLFDLDLVELVLGQPPLQSFHREHNRPLLREASAGLLPDYVRLRNRKARFDTLICDTLAGPDRPALEALLDSSAELAGYIDLDAARRSLFGGPAPRERLRWMESVWRLAGIECWLKAQSDPGLSGLEAKLKTSRAAIRLRRVTAVERGPTSAALVA